MQDKYTTVRNGPWRSVCDDPTGPFGSCIEAAGFGQTAMLRDSTQGNDSPIVELSPGQWRRFTDRIKQGEFDRPAGV